MKMNLHTSREHKKAYLAGVHSDGSFLKAAVVGSVALQEAVQHVQAR
jgi:hypothetical protein